MSYRETQWTDDDTSSDDERASVSTDDDTSSDDERASVSTDDDTSSDDERASVSTDDDTSSDDERASVSTDDDTSSDDQTSPSLLEASLLAVVDTVFFAFTGRASTRPAMSNGETQGTDDDTSSDDQPGMDRRDRRFHRARDSRKRSASEPFVKRTFRGGTVSATDFELSVLTKMHPDYASVKRQFLQKWIKPDPAGGVSVLRILKVKSPEKVRRQNVRYRQTIVTNNVVRRFHGTSCSSSCTFFVDLRGGPCGKSKCNVCSICTHGFRLSKNVGHTARRTGINLRFGHGLYFSSVSGKANDYAEGSEKMNRSGKPIRCMFMASVAVGRAFKTYESALDPSQCPPPGYDSVIGEVGPALNYDEVVVYKEGAALPTFLIVYSPN